MKNNLSNRKALFWDINENDIERTLQESDEWVIPRVFEYGTLEDIADVIDLYGAQKAKDTLEKASLRPMASAMAFLFLNVDRYKKYAA